MNTYSHLNKLVNDLANEGHQEIVVKRLPSQAKRHHKSLYAPKNRKSVRAGSSALNRA